MTASHELLFVGNFLSAAGTHRHYCEDLTERLEGRHWQVVRTSSQPGRIARLLDMVRVTWSARHAYRAAHVDLFSLAAFGWAEVVCFELARLGKPFVLTLRGGNLPNFARQWPRRVARLLRSADRVTAPSTFLRDAMRAQRADIAVIPNALDVARYPFAVRTHPRPRLIWLRAFHHSYNPVLAVEALERLPDATLEMVGPDRGDGSREATLARARALGVADRLIVRDGIAKSEIGALLATADIFLNTTNVDNTPVTVLEAMACGLCVISTDVGGIRHLLHDGRDALLVPPRDPTALAAAVRRILDTPGLAARLSVAARAGAEACDWPTVLDQWDALFNEVIARAG